MGLTSSQEEYLKTIYILETTKQDVRVTEIARRLGYTKPSVTRALNTLKLAELVEYETYGDIKLTDSGISKAKSIIKRYDTLKMFLTEVLEIDESIAEVEATAMKHAVSEQTVTKLENYINKILDLGDLQCCYNSESEKCKTCIKITSKSKLKNK